MIADAISPSNTLDQLGLDPGREALYSHQKQDWELTVTQIMNSLLKNSGGGPKMVEE